MLLMFLKLVTVDKMRQDASFFYLNTIMHCAVCSCILIFTMNQSLLLSVILPLTAPLTFIDLSQTT